MLNDPSDLDKGEDESLSSSDCATESLPKTAKENDCYIKLITKLIRADPLLALGVKMCL